VKEIKGDIWESGANAICVTTNGIVKNDGKAVMGAGIAEQAAKRYPPLPDYLGHCLRQLGNHVFIFPLASNGLDLVDPMIVTFPTKNDWKKNSDIELILQSAKELVVIADQHRWKRVALPRAGCGKGGLKWEQIRPLLQQILDDRFEVWDNK